jgi:diguanylate cyclase (GGDEF)-like protein/PAS domain S-box-containing protein
MSSKISVLVITNNGNRLQQIERMLVDADIIYLTVKDSAAAVSTLKETVFDVIISDTEIGQLDGWRLARMLRAGLFKNSSQTPFILISNTHCEHIAETTASAFAIDKVLSEGNLFNLAETIQLVLSKNTIQANMLAVLIVEDEPDIAELTQRILERNYYIEHAFDGIQALQKFANRHFDIVLLDVQLPGMTGAEVLTHIMEKNPKQAVVIMTAHGGTDLAEQLMINGAVDFIPKPFKAEQLRKVVSIAAHRENYLISNTQFAEKVHIIQRSEEKFRQLSDTHSRMLDNLSTVVMELNTEGTILFTNQAWTKLTGYTENETEHCSLSQFAQSDITRNSNLVGFHIENVIKGSVTKQEVEFQIQNKQHELIWVKVIFNGIVKNGEIVGVTATIDNINDRKIAEIELNHLASHDTLTDLYNRHYFDVQLSKLAGSALALEQTHSLLYLDLDRFKNINDTQGHHQGDIILKEVALNIAGLKRESDIICRVGGDEFALLLPHTNKEQATRIAQNVCDALQQGHYQFEDRIFKISGSVGIAEINGSETLPETYLQQADIALYVAKKRGRNLVHVFTSEDKDSEEFKISVHWVHTLQKAIINDQIVLHFQPVINASSKEVAYFEALVRLDIDGKTVMPGEFIPALERAEDINLLDHQVISKAIYMMSVHKTLSKVAINLSGQAFDDERLLPLIQEKMQQYNVAPQRLIFEITESASLTNLSATQSMIKKLMNLGCELSIDDFGTGFSTFSYLKQIPATSVKIDGSFVRDMVKNPIDKALVRAICDVAKALNKTTVAEFVEDEETVVELQKLGVDYLQGYHISRPKNIQDLERVYAPAILTIPNE